MSDYKATLAVFLLFSEIVKEQSLIDIEGLIWALTIGKSRVKTQ